MKHLHAYAQSIEKQGFIGEGSIYQPIPASNANQSRGYDCYSGTPDFKEDALFTQIGNNRLLKQNFESATSHIAGNVLTSGQVYMSWNESDTTFLLTTGNIWNYQSGLNSLVQKSADTTITYTWTINGFSLSDTEYLEWRNKRGFYLGSDPEHHWTYAQKYNWNTGEYEDWILDWNRSTRVITGEALGNGSSYRAPCDFDGDGDLDIVYIDDGDLKWRKQLGPGIFGGSLPISIGISAQDLTPIRNAPLIAYSQDGNLMLRGLDQPPVELGKGQPVDGIYSSGTHHLYYQNDGIGHQVELSDSLTIATTSLLEGSSRAIYMPTDSTLVLFVDASHFHTYIIGDSTYETLTLINGEPFSYAEIDNPYHLPLISWGSTQYILPNIHLRPPSSVPACDDPVACNYGAEYEACSYLCLFGCADTLACNFSGADDFDFDCNYSCVTGCTDSLACNFASEAIVNAGCDYSCLPPIQGCKDPLAPNFNPVAEIDDNSCLPYPGGCFDLNISETICHGNNLDTLIEYCLDEPSNSKLELIFSGELENIADAITVDVTGVGSFPSFYYSGTFEDTTITSAGVECISIHLVTDASASCQDGFFPPVQFSIECLGQFESGCIDSAACNYAPAALIDAGGCTYPNECGTCELPLSGETGYIVDGTDPIRYETLIERDTSIVLYKEWTLLTPVSYQITDRISIRVSGNSILLSSGSGNSGSYSVDCSEASSFDALDFKFDTELPRLSDFECGPDQGELHFNQSVYALGTQTEGYIIDRLRGEYHRISWEALDATDDSIEIQIGESGRIIKVESPINELPTGYSTASELEILPEYQWQSASFVKVNYTPYNGDGNADVVIDNYLALWRDNQGGLYNLYWPGPLWSCAFPTEDYPDLDDSYFDLNSYDGYFQSCIGNQYLPGHSMFMFSPFDGKLWRIDFTQWTSGQNGGGFAYTRHHIGWKRSPSAGMPVNVSLYGGEIDSIANNMALQFDSYGTFEAPDYGSNYGYVPGVTWGGCGTFETDYYYDHLRYYLEDTQSGYAQFQNSTCFNAYHSPSGQFYEFRFSEASGLGNRIRSNAPQWTWIQPHRLPP